MITADLYLLITIVFIFSIVQSIFGVGLLLFGTPTLLIFGYSYDITLWTILPASILISFIQIVGNYNLIDSKKNVLFYTLPALILGLTIIISYEDVIDMKNIVGVALIFVGILKISSYLNNKLIRLINNNTRFFYLFMGMVHGMSNMGGGPLSVLMSSVYKNKDSIKANIAFVYILFGVSQILVLSIISPNSFQINGILLSLVALVSYAIIGKPLSLKVSNQSYHSFISIFILIYGFFSIIS